MIATRFTERFKVPHPVMLAPMGNVSGGHLAAAVSNAGGLGLIGGGYGDAAWLEQAFDDAGDTPVGVGFITWSVLRRMDLVDLVLAHRPSALMVSFGDGEPIVAAAKEAGVPTIWQIQRLAQARQAHAAGVDVIVVQGQEAGGHGGDRGLTSLLPAVRDVTGPEQIILAAGGIADGRGLAAALMLGADGVMLGTRFLASSEAQGSVTAKERLVATGGDQTLRTRVFDVVRDLDWPASFTGRAIANTLTEQWHDDLDGLNRDKAAQCARYQASAEDDFSTRVLFAGEALDLIDTIEPAADIVHDVVRHASTLLRDGPRRLL
ncbi:nitronate monooxygenase [Mycobacterium spongiae]|uniref:Nitronate monooxygenase n=2 Tax=Mycobacterium spongiae TaxID=886343 RepID=A0A975PZL8_9MYCO|nr:nitronate monooxygenase [Mycobacterium spongiae]